METKKSSIQLSALINMNNWNKVESEIKKIFCYHYPVKYFKPIAICFNHVKKLFMGKFPGYKNVIPFIMILTIPLILSLQRQGSWMVII
ncbi:MAG: hypothetical protein OQK82_07760 [Candidatus Pacearchaeota archaeon]|nr:hypothetical protein [Candidatus Pacearchaeota archaeon]